MNVVKRFQIVFVFSLVTLISTGCNNSPELEPVPYRIIAQGSYSNISLQQRMLVTSPTQLKILWRTHAPTKRNALPAVNFDEEMVIAYFAGQFPSGGYRVEIIRLVETDTGLQIDIKLHRPAKDAMVSLALSQPYIMIATESSDEKIYFNFIK